ncbi:hypothetical protein DPMN_118243, partial [Dreissena polymorpha]
QAHLPLHRRKEPAVRPCDAETLQLLGTHVDRLTKHLQLMCSYLSKTCERNTERYGGFQYKIFRVNHREQSVTVHIKSTSPALDT